MRAPWFLATALAAMAPTAAWAKERWPSWPTEVDRMAAALHSTDERITGERERATALARLEQFATGAIEDEVLLALQDSASQVRREALRLCYLRRITSCIEEASKIWGSGIEPTLRVAALRVLALDLDASRLAIVLGALRDPGDELRAQSAQILGWARPPEGSRPEVRAALLAKLSDSAALVRRRAVESLGQLGPGTGTLAMARLLDDPEPTVRAAAAEALARARDERAAPALIRAAQRQNEAVVSAKILEALAQLPGTDVARALMQTLDDPPPGLSSYQVADAIGNRPEPERELVQGLVDRLREPELGRPVLRALLRLGAPTRPVLERALKRGLDPSLQLEIERLLAALDAPTASAEDADDLPAATDVPGWLRRLRTGSDEARFAAAAALGALAPPWLDAAVARRLRRSGPVDVVLPWLVATATASRELDFGAASGVPWARVQGWARDRSLSTSSRCLSLLALVRAPQGRVPRRAWGRRVAKVVFDLLSDPQPLLRTCAALGSTRWPSLTEAALLDPDARVRAAALLVQRLGGQAQHSATARAALMGQLDPSGEVRTAAALDVAARPTPRRWLAVARPLLPWVRPRRWIQLQVDGRVVWVPALGTGPLRWTILPISADAEVVELRDRR